MDKSCAKILSGLQTSSARLNVICCYARLLEVQLEDIDAAGGLAADKARRRPAQAAGVLPDTMLDCISQAVLEVTAPTSQHHGLLLCLLKDARHGCNAPMHVLEPDAISCTSPDLIRA